MNYILTYNGDVYKQTPKHWLKLSPWKDGEDRRAYEFDSDTCRVISFKNAAMIVNKQFHDTDEEWSREGIEYKASALPQHLDYKQHTAFLKMLPSHKVLLADSKNILQNMSDGGSLTVTSPDNMEELKLVKYNGKIYYILIVNQDLPRVRAYDTFGRFLRWCNIKNCKPVYNKTDEKFI